MVGVLGPIWQNASGFDTWLFVISASGGSRPQGLMEKLVV